MTGFARTSIDFRGLVLTMEIQAVNHRYRDFQVQLPLPSMELERVFRSWLEQVIARGKVTLFVRGELSFQVGAIRLDEIQISKYLESACSLKEKYSLSEPPGLQELYSLPGNVSVQEDREWVEEFKQAAKIPFETLMESFEESRKKEGLVLVESLLVNCAQIRSCMDEIYQLRDGIQDESLKKLRNKLSQLDCQELDENRLHTEAALIVEKMDVEEELVRLGAHLDSVETLMKSDGECGKKLNFLCQEIHREINTIGSKSSSLKIVQLVIEAKSNLEKVREQIQNLE
jgi:uncharacterized protein (TIGR00255 family)